MSDPIIANPGFPEDETRSVDPLLAEGLRRLHAGDTSAWRRLLREQPDRAIELESHVRRLQLHGFLTDAASSAYVGPYKLLRRIGGGGMGIVYRARHEVDNVECAVKLVRPEYLDGDQGRRRFHREVTALQCLGHRGIVGFQDVGIEDVVPWFAMELVEGSSLAGWIAKARDEGADSRALQWLARSNDPPAHDELRPWARFVGTVLVRVLDALQHAHERGVLHRDCKPSNVLVAEDGRAVLIDFGLAHLAAATTITRTGDTLGSLPYMAPELLRADGQPSVASDVYAVGATMYHALGLQLPFVGANAEGVRHGILCSEPRDLRDLDPGLPPAFATICGKAMAPEAKYRYPSAAAFAADLRALLAGAAPLARRPGSWLRLRRWTRRHPLRAIVLAGALAFATVLPTSLLWVQSIELRNTQRLLDLRLVGELVGSERQLWPAEPAVVSRPDGMDAWLVQVDDLLSRKGRYLAEWKALRARGRLMSDGERARDPSWQRIQRQLVELRQNMCDATTEKKASWEDWYAELREHEAPLLRRLEVAEGVAFADPVEARRFQELSDLVLGIEELATLRDRVSARRELVGRLRAASLDDAAEAWRATLDAIADPVHNPRYRGLRMQPQFGLVPLGQDSESGLFEFAHLASGAPPVRGADGKFRIDEAHGIVLVLLPGGHVRVGADLDPAGALYDPDAAASDTPSVEVRLVPFFLGKYEVTQAQWVRQRGHNNCLIKPGSAVENPDRPVTGAHPVDLVSYLEASRITREWGLSLPTGAQWEYAARGGTTGPTWCGNRPELLDGAANLFDRDLLSTPWNSGGDHGHVQPADGWPVHAPVGRFRANPFGFHDVLGNVAELTLDAPRRYDFGLRDGDGRTGNVDSGALRGSAFNTAARECRVSRRIDTVPDLPTGGLRAARALEGEWEQEPDR
jgi:serine/threonine protein kinase/formylglycine-generating enzyme required for sulfatase activity